MILLGGDVVEMAWIDCFQMFGYFVGVLEDVADYGWAYYDALALSCCALGYHAGK